MNRPVDPADLAQVILAHEDRFRVGGLLVEPALRRLSMPSEGRQAILEPKVMQVLVALAREPGRILSRDDLVEICWDGVIVGDDAVHRVISQLRKRLAQIAGEAVTIETITKVGYQLRLADGPPDHVAPDDGARERRIPFLLLALALLVAALGATAWLTRDAEPQRTPHAAVTRLVLLPIDTADPDDRHFAAGLRTGLARWLKGTGRYVLLGDGSIAALRQSDVPPDEMLARLEADELWALSLSNEGGSVEILATQWLAGQSRPAARRSLTGRLSDAGTLQRNLANLVSTASQPPGAEGASGELVPVLTGGDEQIYLTAVGLLETNEARQASAARDLLRPLLERNPGNGAVMVQLAKALALEKFLTAPRPHNLAPSDEALALAARARQVAPNLPEAYMIAAYIRGPRPSDRADLERAYALDPDNSEIASNLALLDYTDLDLDRSWQIAYRAWQLDPFSEAFDDMGSIAASLGKGELADAIDRRMMRFHPDRHARERAHGRLLMRQGDLSRAMVHFARAIPEDNSIRQRLSEDTYARGLQFLWIERPIEGDRMSEAAHRILQGTLPSRSFLRERGVDQYDLFRLWRVLQASAQLYIAEGRAAELVRHYDRAFDGPADFERKLQDDYVNGATKQIMIAPYLAIALRDVGREEEATSILADARRRLGRLDDNRLRSASFEFWDARIAAVEGKRARALDRLASARALGFPFNDAGWPIVQGMTLAEDPAFARLAEDPALRRLSDEIDADRRRERAETLAAIPGLAGN